MLLLILGEKMNKALVYIKKYFYLIIGILLVSISFNLFLSPNDLAAGGISGLALVFSKLYNIEVSKFILISNVLLIIVSYICLGKEQTGRTVLGSILFPIFINLTSNICNYVDITEVDLIVKCLFGGVLSGIGYGLVFKHGFTSGGTDIIDQLVSKYYKLNMSTSLILVDGFVVLAGGLVFGIEKMIYSAICLVLLSIYSNKSMIGNNDYKSFYITTNKTKQVKTFLINKYNYNVTLLDAKGGFTNKKRKLILSVIRTSDYYEIKEALKLIDPNMFITIANSYETINHHKAL